MLPTIDYPIIAIDVHSLNRKVTFRPFLVKEEKLLLIAKESQDLDDIRTAIIQIIRNCCLDDKVEIEKLPLYDTEMIFVKLRAASVGEKVQLVFNCKNEIDGQVCGEANDYSLDLSKVRYEVPEGHTDTIMLTDKIGMKLRVPDMSAPMELNLDNSEAVFETIIAMILNHVEFIFDEESTYAPDKFTPEEFAMFIDNLSMGALEQIQGFFSTTPKVVLEDKVECKKCGHHHEIYSEDLLSFFI